MQIHENISIQIKNIHSYFSDYANRKVNYAYTLRNWLIGMYLFEIEQKGHERAEYGDKLYRKIAERLKERNIKGMSFIMLHNFNFFFQTYPSIVQSVTEQFQVSKNHQYTIVQSLIEQFKLENNRNFQSLIGQFGLESKVKS